MNVLVGNEVVAADLILQYGGTVYLPVLFTKGNPSGLTIDEIETAGQFLKTIGFVEISTTEMGITYTLTNEGYDFAKSNRSIRDKITEIETKTIKTQTKKRIQSETIKQDKILERKSWKASRKGIWIGIIGILFTIILFIIDKCVLQHPQTNQM